MEKTIAQLQGQRNQLTAGANKTEREAVVFVTADKDGPVTFDLSYLVTNVDWTPAYNARLSADRAQLNLEYQAVVNQTNGEDWKDVALTLSTTRPNMSADTPSLSPMVVSLAAGSPGPQGPRGDVGPQGASPYGTTSPYGNARDYSRAQKDLDRQAKGGDSLSLDQFATPQVNPTTGPNAVSATPPWGGGESQSPAPMSEAQLLQRNILAARAQNLGETGTFASIVPHPRRARAESGAGSGR